MKIFKHRFIRYESYKSAVFFFAGYFLVFLDQHPAFEFSRFFAPFPIGSNFKIMAQGIHGFRTYAIQSNTFLEGFAIVFCSGIDLTHHIHHFTQGNTPSIIPNGYCFSGNDYINMFTITHGMFINTIINHFFQQHINAIVCAAAITKFTDIHTGPEPDMLAPVEAPDAGFVIIKKVFFSHELF